MCCAVRRPRFARDALTLLASLTFVACSRPPPPAPDGAPALASPVDGDATLTFRLDGRTLRAPSLAALARDIPPETVTTVDPYYGRVKRFVALPLDRVLVAGFAGEGGALATRQFVLRARDGYTVPIAGERLLEGGAYIAIRDVDALAWEPIGPQRANPAPAYLIWSRSAQGDLETHPRPWQLASIEVARFEDVFPHVAPVGEAPGSPASLGFALFARECVRCHAINREGGRVGPELNVPQNVTEYRPEAQIRAYIRDPRTFRYGNMPAHPGFTDSDLDHLIAYLHAMASRKHDPDAPHDAGP